MSNPLEKDDQVLGKSDTEATAGDIDEQAVNSAEQENTQENITPSQVDIGAKLVKARENQNLSIEDIASRLNLTVKVIAQLESNQFNQDLPLTFVRGYIRSYAQKVGIDTETLTAEFDQQTQLKDKSIQKIKSISSFKSGYRREVNSNHIVFKSLTIIIVIGLLSFAGWEAWKRFGVNPSSQNSNDALNQIELSTAGSINAGSNDVTNDNSFEDSITQQEPLKVTEQPVQISITSSEVSSVVSAEPVAESRAADAKLENENALQLEQQKQQAAEITAQQNASAEDENALAETAASSSVDGTDNTETGSANINNQQQTEPLSQIEAATEEAAEVKTMIPLTAENSLTTEFVFNADCWVKVTDANGEVLAIGVKKNGKIMPLQGVAPFSVTLGNPAAVRLTVDDLPYDLSGFNAGQIAKFELSKK